MLVTILRIALAVAAVINVYGCWSMNKRIADVSKVFLMPLVMAIYFARLAQNAAAALPGAAGNAAGGAGTGLAGNASAVGGTGAGLFAALSIPLLLGMIAGYLGDLFLLKDSLFTAGLGAFRLEAADGPASSHPHSLYHLYSLAEEAPDSLGSGKYEDTSLCLHGGYCRHERMRLPALFGRGRRTLCGIYLLYLPRERPFCGLILAMTVFKRDVGSFMEVGVMITYVFAQFLIMWGMVNAI